jgi:glutamate-ammonia-ligase adenylyltransferase
MQVLTLLAPEPRRRWDAVHFADTPRAERLLQRFAERAGDPPEATALAEALLEQLAEAPDPEMALLNLERWSGQLPTPATALRPLRENPRLLADLLAILGSSQYLAAILIREPWLHGLFEGAPASRTPKHFDREVASALTSSRKPDGRRDGLRRVKRREFLRIGWRDLARAAPFAELVREISDLTDALIAGALRLAREEVDARFATAARETRFAVLALGKLGARELNYSSDVDLVFVMDSVAGIELCDVHRRYATRLAETFIAALSQETAEGRCARVDMRLRPEGRTGALVRSYQAFCTYYEGWAETWERQALIKCRAVAGDEDLGRRFEELARAAAFRTHQGATLVEDVREMRQAMEAKLSAAGELDRNIKEGRGSVRDVEFSLQLLQLLFGAEHPSLQARDTLTVLTVMRAVGVLTETECRDLEEAYVFFRTVEHRLQLMNDLPVRLVPESGPELRRLARSLGFPDEASFTAERRRHTERSRAFVSQLHERLAHEHAAGPEGALRSTLLAADRPEGSDLLLAELERRSFPESGEALPALVRLAAGTGDWRHPAPTRRAFADIAAEVLAGCERAADPTWALQGVADLADRKLLHRQLYQTWREHPTVLHALCAYTGAAPRMVRTLLRYPELTDLVTDLEQLGAPQSLNSLRRDLSERLESAGSSARRLSALRRFKLRELVRLSARHVIVRPPASAITAEWSEVADVLIEASLEEAVSRLRTAGRWEREGADGFAVLALGRHGGRDLHFASDLDLLYVFSESEGASQQQFEALGRALAEVVQTVTEDGPLFEIDTRLRPEGRQGFSVTGIEAARRYYGEGGRAQTWEFQSLTRPRFIAGDRNTADDFMRVVMPRVYRSPMPAGWTEEIRAMKRRIETERATEGDRERHLKLGPGGLSDIEFLVQWLQLREGAGSAAIKSVEIQGALRGLEEAGILPAKEVVALLGAHEGLTRVRQSNWLLRQESGVDLIPSPEREPRLATALARATGYESIAGMSAQLGALRREVRAIVVARLGLTP